MKKGGILHSELARIVAGIGHGDRLVICDCGFPVPHGKPVADLVLTIGIPGIIQTLDVVLKELHIEGVVVAQEMERRSPHILQQVRAAVGTAPLTMIPHEQFKRVTLTEGNISFVRTGEATPFSNVMLVAGVVF